MSVKLDLAKLRDKVEAAIDAQRGIMVKPREMRAILDRLVTAEATVTRVREYRTELATAGFDPDLTDNHPARYFFEGNDADVVEGLDLALDGPKKAEGAA